MKKTWLSIWTLFLLSLAVRVLDAQPAPPLQAGAHVVDISPVKLPVIVNAMFTERSADKVVDPLLAKALVLDDGTSRLALCVVDSCMVPRDLLDEAKALAAKATGIPTERMLISATHTHSAPSAMGCLGSRVDPDYARSLPPRIAEAIIGAARRLAPARVGWTAVDDWDHTFNRRWIRRPDRLLTDPFGQATVRAHMHPGHESPDAIGPSGPVDPALTLLAVTTPSGAPLAVLANYSQHYYGSPLLSSDYYGRFATHLAEGLGAGEGFVGILSQGTSGDQMWMDYGAPARDIGYDAYGQEVAARALEAYRTIEWRDSAPLRMAERTLALRYRVPDAARLAWARALTAALGARLPASQPEIYAREALYLHERQETTLTLQALRVGDLGLTAIPNEVFAITGLKLKAQSPFALTMNISLANGAEGYIPPPEQHALGGYTTWPARTAGLQVEAEPRIVEALLGLLEEVAGAPRRPLAQEAGPYPQAVFADRPLAYWRLDEIIVPTAHDATGHGHDATLEDGVALYLPGPGSGAGVSPKAALGPSSFSGAQINRAVHFAGGRLRARAPLGEVYTVELWVWNGLAAEARAVTGYFYSRGLDGEPTARGEHLGIGGTYRADLTGKLILFGGNERNELLVGRTTLALRAWHHVVLVREGRRVRVHLDGRPEPELAGELELTVPPGEESVFLGGRSDGLFNLEGRLDEVALYPRALGAEEIAAHYRASDLTPPVAAAAAPSTLTLPLSPEESLSKIHVSAGYRVELVASEPLTRDPVAIDWDGVGRLWVVEMADYPLGLDGAGKPGGRVRRLEDTDGDGRCDRSSLFADGLNFPTGLLVWRDGVLVTAAPEVLFLRDTDGDGEADTRDVVVSGLLEGNQQLRANGLRWGLDNWVYCAAGGHHGDYGVGTRLRARAGDVLVGSRDFRFRPDTGELEPESGPTQFGRERDDWGHWFGTQNIRPLWHYVLADHYLRRNPHVAAPDPTRQLVVPLSPKVWPVSAPEKRYHSFDHAGHFTSACSGMVYRDVLLFPGSPEGELHVFTCEPFHNLVQRNVLSEDGVSFRARRAAGEEASDLFASEDRWCRPVMTRTGPDGALWVVDMYRYMIEHPQWLPEEGRAELLPHYRAGEDRGRIYRVLPVGVAPRAPTRLDGADTQALVAALDSPNGWQRDRAHQLLLQRADPDAPALLSTLARESDRPQARLHALCVLDGLHALTPELVARALADSHPGVRENALRLAERNGTPEVIAAASKLLQDPSANVRLQLALTLGEWTAARAGEALGRLAVAEVGEPYTLAAALSSAGPHCLALARAAVKAGDPALSLLAEPLLDLALAEGERDAVAALLSRTLVPGKGGLSAGQMEQLARFLDALARRRTTLEELAQGDDALSLRLGAVEALVATARALAADASAPTAHRAAALGLLTRRPSTRAAAIALLAGWLAPTEAGELQRAAIRALAETGDDGVPALLLEALESFSPETRAAALDVLLTREPWTRALLEHEPEAPFPLLDVARRAQLLQHPSARVRELAARRLGPRESRARVLEQFRPALQLTGDARRGQGVFSRLCVTCHRLGDSGKDVGPNLRSVAGHPPEKLLASILDPSADVQPGYNAYYCQLVDGTELHGLIASETASSLTFKLTDGATRTVLRLDITLLQGADVSFMPEGLEAGLLPQDLADLIQYLKSDDERPLEDPASPAR